MTRSIQKGSEEVDAKLQDCFANNRLEYVSWDSSNGIEEFTTSVTGFINKCINDDVPIVTVHTYHNQMPWIAINIRTELKAKSCHFQVL